MAEPLQRIPAV